MKILAILLLLAGLAHADPRSDRASLSKAIAKLSTSAQELGKIAKGADDRGARKKFAPAATELGDDLAALVRRIDKDAPLKSVITDAAEIEKAASKLVDLADEVEDKEDRKNLRQQAGLIAQSFATQRKQLEALAAAEGAAAAPAAAKSYTGRILNNSDSCSWAENLKFVVSANGAQVFASQLVFPGKEQPLVLGAGTYVVRFFDTSGSPMGQGNLVADREGWLFKSGCVNKD